MQNQPGTITRNDAPLTMGNYFISIIIAAIPVVGFIMLLVWSFSSSENINKKNWARAHLLFSIIINILYIIGLAIFGSVFFASIASLVELMY